MARGWDTAERPRPALNVAPTRPEIELLLCCARFQTGSEVGDAVRPPSRRGTDWTWLVRQTRWHGVLLPPPRFLPSTPLDGIPPAVLTEFAERARRIAHHNLFLTGQLVDLLGRFAAAGIAAVPVKGPTLAALAYGDLARRESFDLDILVRRQDVAAAVDLLRSLDYRADLVLSPGAEAARLATQYHRRLARNPGPVVELHWRFAPCYFPFALRPEQARLTQLRLGSATVHTLAPEHLLLVLAVHGAKHLWERLIWICDVAALIRNVGLNWPDVISESGRLGVARVVRLSLVLARDLLAAPLPDAVDDWVEGDPGLAELAALARQRLFATERRPVESAERFRFYAKARERWRDKARCAFHTVATPTITDFQLAALPAGLHPLYYVVRPLRLVAKWGVKLATLQRRPPSATT